VEKRHSILSPALLNKSSLFMYTCRLLSDRCLLRFWISLIGTARSLHDECFVCMLCDWSAKQQEKSKPGQPLQLTQRAGY
jgi:hypothetical protein